MGRRLAHRNPRRRYDDLIRERAEALKALGAGAPPLAVGDEPAEPPAGDPQPDDYVKAWKHPRDLRRRGATTSTGCGARSPTASRTDGPAYYPGDDQVDWLCADAYTHSPATPLRTVLEPFLDWAKDHDRPIIIGEFGTHQGLPGERAAWLDEAFRDLKASSQVKAVVYYESANAPAGRYDIAGEADTLQVMRTWGAKPWLNPAWAPSK